MNVLLGQVDNSLPPAARAVRDHLREGGSFTQAVLVIGVVLAAVGLVYLLTRLPRRREEVARRQEPKRLFGDLLDDVKLSPSRRSLLESLATELRLEHPTVLLLSPIIYDRHIELWLAGRRAQGIEAPERSRAELTRPIRDTLFPPTTVPQPTSTDVSPQPRAMQNKPGQG